LLCDVKLELLHKLFEAAELFVSEQRFHELWQPMHGINAGLVPHLNVFLFAIYVDLDVITEV
jgi:hypothetical protein